MEDFNPEKPEIVSNQLQLDTERSENPSETPREKFREGHQRVFNDTIETLDNEEI
jgi:hypothetical protein